MKSKRMNFNQYMIALEPSTALSRIWAARRGRMTRASVELRAANYGLTGAGYKAWDAFLLTRDVVEAAEGNAVLAMDPSR
jgi:hypothetical protein